MEVPSMESLEIAVHLLQLVLAGLLLALGVPAIFSLARLIRKGIFR